MISYDSQAFSKDLKVYIKNVMGILTSKMINRINGRLTSFGRNDNELLDPVDNGGIIEAQIISYTNAILDSYGRGRGIDTTSPFIEAYTKSEYWNDERKGIGVYGRAAGPYTDIRGKEQTSKGFLRGILLKNFDIKASMAIQETEEEFFGVNGEIHQQVTAAFDEFVLKNFNKYWKVR